MYESITQSITAREKKERESLRIFFRTLMRSLTLRLLIALSEVPSLLVIYHENVWLFDGSPGPLQPRYNRSLPHWESLKYPLSRLQSLGK